MRAPVEELSAVMACRDRESGPVRFRAGVFTLAGPVLASLALATPLAAAQEEGGGLFAINPGLMIWTWLVFIILLLVLRKWAWGPILGALDAREKRIQQTLDEASREREEARHLLEEQRQLLNESREQAQQVLADSRKAGERVRSELLEEARRQREQILEQARDEIHRERDQALETLRRETVDLSIAAARRVLGREVDSSENRRLVEEYLSGIVVEDEGAGAT